MSSHKEALDLIVNIKRDIDRNRKIYEILPKILELSKIISNQKLEDICILELSGYFQTSKIKAEKIEQYAIEVGRKRIINEEDLENSYLTDSLIQIEERINELTGDKRPSASHYRNKIIGIRSSIEAFFINEIADILRQLKEYYPIKLIDSYLEEIMLKTEKISDSLIDKIKSIYNNLFSTEEGDLINIPELSRKILVELGDLLFPIEKIVEENSNKYYICKNGDKIIIQETERNYKNKLIAFFDYKINIKNEKDLFKSDLELLTDNIVKFSDTISALSHIREMKEEYKKPIISLAIKIIIFIGDLVYFID